MVQKRVARRSTYPFLSVLLLVALLALSGCRGSWQPAPVPLPTSTLVPTLPAPTDTPVVVEPTATTEPTATEATVEEATATPEVIATEAVTETEAITETEEITRAEEATVTEATTATEGITATVEVTETEEITAGADVTETEAVTAAEGVTTTEEVTATEGITTGEEVTATSAFTAAAGDARVYFLQPTTNAIVPMTFTVVMSYTGVTLAPAADGMADAGHMHILIDSDYIPAGDIIPNDELHRHFGDGSTRAELSLTPGSHLLRLQFADNNHVALEGDQFRHEIVVNVVDGAPEQSVRIVSPTSNATVPPTFTVVMAASGVSVEPSGPVHEEAGHFHLLLDEPYVAPGEIIPTDETHLHFGKAQLTTTVTLEPGSYLLRLQMADGAHRALSGDQYRDEITVVVEEDAPAEQVMFVKPADDATVTSPFLLAWAANGLIIEPAGYVIRPNAGHLHVLINEEFVPGGEIIPTDETHLHFGKGQTSTELTLEPGEYTLRLQMANGSHIAHEGSQYRDEITVTVK